MDNIYDQHGNEIYCEIKEYIPNFCTGFDTQDWTVIKETEDVLKQPCVLKYNGGVFSLYPDDAEPATITHDGYVAMFIKGPIKQQKKIIELLNTIGV